MLNWAARYYPIVRILKAHGLFESASLLELGSGPVGIGLFRKVPFVGCDISFSATPAWPMTPMRASAAQLPVRDKEFEVVVASDVLEHVPVAVRSTVINEAKRVAGKLVIFGFPCGQVAWQSDRDLITKYVKRGVPAPDWLTEHMDAPFPERDLIEECDGWEIERVGNENIGFHAWMMAREMSRSFVRLSSLCMRATPRLTELLLQRADKPPFYRQIVVLRRIANH